MFLKAFSVHKRRRTAAFLVGLFCFFIPFENAAAQNSIGQSTSAADSVYTVVDVFPVGIPTTKKMMSRITKAIDRRAYRKHPRILAILYLNVLGEVEQIELEESMEDECEKSVVRALIQEAKFSPGLVGGNPVKVKMAIPFRFQ